MDLENITWTGDPALFQKIKKERTHSQRIKGKFLKGPIPLDWIETASKLSGKALSVGIAIWFLSGVTKSNVVKLSSSLLRRMGVKRTTGYRALRNLETAGLVSVVRHKGRNPIVAIIETQEIQPLLT